MRLLTSQSGLLKVVPGRLHHANIRQAGIRDRRRGRTWESSKKGGVFVDVGGNIGQRINSLLVGDSRDGGLRGSLRFCFMIRQLVNGDNLTIMREKHLVVDCGWDGRHGIGVTTPKKNVVFKRSIDKFNVDTNSLACKGDRTVTE